ncbi:hypothetical protein OVY01_00660 [Robbsia sp. Bb-Pol-6]|uniref:Uncharacterized protein n=1 Tax=Robbsia betulipollinis TaxID=2981849 RepID=A0ABT3ZGX9_9BURK|nr:hypothetical protein [Robbsia betulipollinis]MCY0385774.1 hypothetical protein [Robbsia betulipollinis]
MNKKMTPAYRAIATVAAGTALAILSVALSPAAFAQSTGATPPNGANATTTMSPGTSANSSYSPPVDDYKKKSTTTRRHRASKKTGTPASTVPAAE